MEAIEQQITACLKSLLENIMRSMINFEQELIEIVGKLYNVLKINKVQEKATVRNKTRTDYTIAILNTMKKDNLKQSCTEYGIKTGNLKKND